MEHINKEKNKQQIADWQYTQSSVGCGSFYKQYAPTELRYSSVWVLL